MSFEMAGYDFAEKYDGKVHKKCGTTLKYVSCGVCVACSKAKSAAAEAHKRLKRRIKKKIAYVIRLGESF